MKTALDLKNQVVIRQKKVKNGFSLYLDFSVNKRRYKEYIQIVIRNPAKLSDDDKEKLRLAETIRKKREIEILAKINDETDFIPKKKSFSSFLDELMASKENALPNTLKKYKSLINHLSAFQNYDIMFRDINSEWLENFKEYLLANLKKGTADCYFNTLKTVLNEARKRRLIAYNPCDDVKGIGRDKSLPKYLTFEEVVILDQTECRLPDVKRAFLFACFSGERLCDLRQLKWKNVVTTMGQTYLNFHQQKTDTGEINPLSEQAVDYLGEAGYPDEAVFNLPSNDWTINKCLKKWAETANLKKNLHFHMSRHTFGTLMYTQVNDLYVVSKLLNHASTKHTERYARVVDQTKINAIKKMPKIGRGAF